MGRNGFTRQLRHVCRGCGDSPPHNVRRAETGEARTVRADKERARIMVIDPTFAYQCLQRFDEVGEIGTTRSLRPLPRRSTCGRG